MMSRAKLPQLASFFIGRIHHNYRLLSSAPIVAVPAPATKKDSFSGAAGQEDIHMTDNCIQRIKELGAEGSSGVDKMLRLSVETGGCSGFQYVFALDGQKNPDDRIFEKDGVKLVVDNISYDFVKGATVDYVEELIRSAFIVTSNPSAVGGCSCKSSFMVK